MESLAVPLIVIGIIVIAIWATYNKLVRLKNTTEESWSGIDTELKRRYDLIPNLVETVSGYAKHEKEVFVEAPVYESFMA
ncbi:MAG TPA: LemA family protein, partial [Candidatus Omnitrophota bacterium]|nr:LemA family protein [Candidatus Omnitrophota bacterium]